MEMAADNHAASRRPGGLDVAAGLALLATVVLHVVAMVPTYFNLTGSLISQADQATIYGIVAAAWALALVIGLTGPHRTPVAAGLAVGVGLTEFGFRVADLGLVIRYGTGTVGPGFWLMEVAWVVGAAGAGLAVLAARARHRPVADRESAPLPLPDLDIDWAAPVAPQGFEDGSPTLSMSDPTRDGPPLGGDTEMLPVAGLLDHEEDDHERLAWTLLVFILAAVTAGAFLPPWDHVIATSTSNGGSKTINLGNAFNGPWQQVIGTVLVSVSLLVVPVVAVRLRNKAAGAAAVCGALLILASQLASAVVQVSQPVPPADVGMSAGELQQIGVELSLKLTGWFVVDALAAYALFAAIMVWATLRYGPENSTGTPPRAPEVRNEAMPSAS
jgi:hypothetical protein